MADLYLDNDVSAHLIPVLIARGHNVRHARDLGMTRAKDYHQLFFAAHQSRIFVSHNLRDFRLLHGAWRHWTNTWDRTDQHGGVLLLDQVRPAGIPLLTEALDAILTSDLPLPNELYEWRRHNNLWEHKPFIP